MQTQATATSWQSAASAPKDSVIIGCFKNFPLAMAATWNEPENQWVMADVKAEFINGKMHDTFFQTEYATSNELLRWMLMPEVA